MMRKNNSLSKEIFSSAVAEAFKKLSPGKQLENPVMFLVYMSSVLTTLLFVAGATGFYEDAPVWFSLAIAVLLWFTVLFANFAEAIAEGRGKAQADALRSAKKDVDAFRLISPDYQAEGEVVAASSLRPGDFVLVRAGEQIPADGEVVQGAASVDESAVTGESAPVIRESGGDRSAVTGGTQVLSDWLVIQVTSEPGKSFLDKMIAMVEGAARKKTPNELALQIFLVALSIIFILVTMSLYSYKWFAQNELNVHEVISVTQLTALLVCLAPTTIGALLSAIGIAGMSRLNQANVLAMSGRAIEAAGDVDVLLLDKTGTITLGNRQASEFIPVDGATAEELADAAQLASLADETPEGRSIVQLAKEQFGIRERQLAENEVTFVPFAAQTRMSGADIGTMQIRKGAADALQRYIEEKGGVFSEECRQAVDRVAKAGGTPLVVARDARILGVIYLKDIIKDGVKDKFADLRRMGIKTIMITGDNPVTAAAIAAEAGVDDFLAEATPEAKLAMIRDYQAKGHMVAMTGDGTNDAPALAQADVAVAMNTGTQAAKEAGNMVDLDSSPTKLIEIVRIGKQLLMTRGSLTTFSIANDLAKYFAIVPALFAGLYPQLNALNVMGLKSPETAILSAVVYNAFIIVALIPLALKGVAYREASAASMLRHNLLVYGAGGIIVPFVCIKLLDMLFGLFI
ncbi:potassium-transporting ATPase subunit KdpB [Veillonellaceae bacterium WCA-693-APC-5D-A]|uniref:Potassium-transporting ATPase ATP-binding subunit n=1 Tax=Anaerovibrio slackiae TaxID=2652309 RepID=A0A6I2UF25_9FIRM|nr:potassium-transporting ATPase subunit KdpB [Anaerovibrio slackiae]MSU07761.1 potassium-transporting ATPase subunit KdpB [Anaerovibrio slackiae]